MKKQQRHKLQFTSVEEYLARDDVDYTVGSVYYDAVKNVNSNINDYYTNNVQDITTVTIKNYWSNQMLGQEVTLDKGNKNCNPDTGIDWIVQSL